MRIEDGRFGIALGRPARRGCELSRRRRGAGAREFGMESGAVLGWMGIGDGRTGNLELGVGGRGPWLLIYPWSCGELRCQEVKLPLMSVFLGPWSSTRCMSCKVRVVVWGDSDDGRWRDHTFGDADRELGPLGLVCFTAPMIHSWRQFKRARSALCRGACNPTPATSRRCTGTSPCWPSSSIWKVPTYRPSPTPILQLSAATTVGVFIRKIQIDRRGRFFCDNKRLR
jgi:hypothetical protein